MWCVQGCTITPDIALVDMRTRVNEAYVWKPEQSIKAERGTRVPHGDTKSFK